MEISTTPSTERSPLQKAIFANGVFSGSSGAFMLAFSGAINNFLGLGSPQIIAAAGLVLLLYAPALFWLASNRPIRRGLAWLVFELDVLWVLGSAILIFTDLVPLTLHGKWAIAIVADIVAVFAVLQYLGLRKEFTL